jgi:riboflavin kinase/FMN adenylyltransferase
MNFCDTLESLPELDKAFVTIGNFDGLHLGHRSLIDSMKARAKGAPLVAITFAESPRKLYAPEKFTGYILPLSYKRRLFSMLGLDYLVNLDFNKVKDVPAGTSSSTRCSLA